ncbi:MAG: diguanylate cyclase, partial [Lachnospiraceae bacterium]|nr:diguanylate cyclase [Lachnospiraceae bacterium]
MSEQLKQEQVLTHSFASTEAGRDELYMYSLRKMADENVHKDVNLITNLPTLRAFFYTGDEVIMKYAEKEFALVVLDIAQFKAVNEFCGRSAGDYVLKQIAAALTKITDARSLSYACHMRADIFVLLTPYLGQDDIVSVVNELKSDIDNIEVDCKLLPAFGICTTINNGRA